jgi:CubicO group peptidase (beta-lactamase class C family)
MDMKGIFLLAFLGLIFVFGGCGQSRDTPADPSVESPSSSPTASPTPVPIIPPRDERIQRVESGLIPISAQGQPEWDEAKTLAERMDHYLTPGVSIAVIDNYQIDWAKGYGVLEAGGNEDVTADTLFHAGSVAKPVSAAAVLAFVEKGMLDLDEDVNETLLSWQVPENEFTAEEKVTLRRLLSHSAGLQDGFTGRSSSEQRPAYLTGAGVAPAVTLEQLLDGDPEVDVDGASIVASVPGSTYQYSNADYAIIELLVEDVVQQPFHEFMQEIVLEPLEMANSTFAQPIPMELRERAATEHDNHGRPFEEERLHFPFKAAGSLWTTPSDLSRFAIEIMQSYQGAVRCAPLP